MRKSIYFLFLLFSVNSVIAKSEKSLEDSIPFYQMTLEQLMNVTVSVVSDLPMNGRESPGIVTVLTREEILESGAKDLMQILQLIPGFDFGVDVEGVVGIGIRGNWGHEGKVLMLWDGIEMNEDLYSTLQFGGHYPLSQVKRIEIIRGPGSAIYGGNAEYAVINIITINSDLNGLAVDAQYSSFSKDPASQGVSVAYGKKWKNSHVSFSTFQNKTIRSNKEYTDNFGNSYSLRNLSSMTSEQYRVNFTYRKFNIMAFSDDYTLLQRDGYEEVYSQAYRSLFLNSTVQAKVDCAIGKLKLTPGVKIKFGHPWYSNQVSIEDNFQPYSVTSQKQHYYISYLIDPSKKINITGGFIYDYLLANNRTEGSTFTDGSKSFVSYDYGSYIQAIFKTKVANFTLGSRYVYNKFYKGSFVPRLGITKIWDKFHVKALYSVGYRAPAIENINLNQDIKPEYTSVLEIEGGVKLGHSSYLTANIYDITTKNGIIFYYDSTNGDSYENEGETGTRGLEIDYKWKSEKWYAMINYSFYTTAGHSVIDEYRIDEIPNITQAFPAHKINFSGSWRFGKTLSVGPSISFYSKRYTIITSQDNAVKVYPAVAYENINFSFANLFTQGLTVQFSVFNIMDEDVWYIQPYNGNHAPLPGGGREFQIRLNYNLSSH